jgi:hypothetical protein
MNEVIDQSNWAEFLKKYSERNEGKCTRMGVFDNSDGVTNDYWIEDGLPLIGLDSYSEKGRRRIDILFENYTHSIDDAAVLVSIGEAGADDGLDISDTRGVTTQLRIEDWKPNSNEQNNG